MRAVARTLGVRASTVAVLIGMAVLPVSIGLTGCADSNRNESIKEAGHGVELAQRRQYPAAIEALEKAVSMHPENHNAHYNLGQIYVMQKEWEKASEAFGEAVKYNDDDAMYHYYLGRTHLEGGKTDLANTHLEKALQLNERLYKAHHFLGVARDRAGKTKEAAQSWSQAAMLNPVFGLPFIELGALYIKWDKINEAVSVLEQGSLHVKDAKDLSTIYYWLGMAYDEQKQPEKAIEAYGKSIEVRPSNYLARLQRGLSYADKGDKANARTDLEAFIKSGGGGNKFLVQLANQKLMKLVVGVP